MRIYLISPVRKSTPESEAKVSAYVAKLEAQGHEVFWPLRDGDENLSSFEIIAGNVEKMRQADEIHIWWEPTSEGSVFDFGYAWGTEKPIVLANPEDIEETSEKSFTNCLLELCFGYPYL